MALLDVIYTSQFATAIFILILIYVLVTYLNSPKNLPPGPWGLPFIGYALFLGKKPQETINKLKAKYGDIIRLKLGRESYFFLTSYKVMKEALIKQADVFSTRPIHHYPPQLRATPGIIGGNGELYMELRRFSLSKLKDFGFGKSSLEEPMKDEIAHFLKEIELHKGKPLPNINIFLHKSIFNVICVIMTGQRYDYKDEVFITLLESLHNHMKTIGIDRFIDYIPYSLQIPAVIKALGIQSALQTYLELKTAILNIIDELETTHKAESENNFIDAWLAESKQNAAKNKYLTKTHLPSVLIDFFLAGSDTTTNALGWSLLYMIKHPEIQTKVQREIDDVIGRERTPAMSDQKLMPYTEATLMEVNRIVTIAPLALEHMACKDTTLQGYFVPKNTIIILNLWSVLHDPEIFPKPDEFKPERFLTDNGEINKNEEYIPFSLGKRQCMGESLAKMELFLYFTSMLQHFTFKKIEGSEVDFDYHFSLATTPKPQPMYAVAR